MVWPKPGRSVDGETVEDIHTPNRRALNSKLVLPPGFLTEKPGIQGPAETGL